MTSWLAWMALSATEQVRGRHEIVQICSRIAQDIPGYLLRINLQGRFWEELEKVLIDHRNG